eukprot:2218785-Heterocapsa_arctica.AAC.1
MLGEHLDRVVAKGRDRRARREPIHGPVAKRAVDELARPGEAANGPWMSIRLHDPLNRRRPEVQQVEVEERVRHDERGAAGG